MNKLILPMGATHIDHDKLVNIVDRIENQAKMGLFSGATSVNDTERDRINSIYRDPRITGILNPIYQYVEYADEEKIDGFSYTCDNGEFISRKLSEAKGNEGHPIIKTGHVPHLAGTLKTVATISDFYIHGELYKPGGTSDDVTKIMGCAEDKAIDRQKYPDDKLHYMVHDIMRYNGIDVTSEPWYVRRALLEYWYNGCMLDNAFIHLSKINGSPIKSFNRIVSSGGEGLMLKKTNGLYVPGKKPAGNWIKCKKEITLETVIMGYNNDGSGKNAGLFKSIQVGLWNGNDDRLVHVGDIHSGISDSLRRQMHDDRDGYIGRVIETDAMDFNNNKWSLRHARLVRFRDDKSQSECTADGIRVKVDII